MKIYDDVIKSLIMIDLDDDLDKQLVAAYILGMLNWKAHMESRTKWYSAKESFSKDRYCFWKRFYISQTKNV